MLDSSLGYISHELIDNTLYINVISNKHDLPIQGKKVIILLKNRNIRI